MPPIWRGLGLLWLAGMAGGAAMILRNSQGDTPRGENGAKDLAIILSSLLSFLSFLYATYILLPIIPSFLSPQSDSYRSISNEHEDVEQAQTTYQHSSLPPLHPTLPLERLDRPDSIDVGLDLEVVSAPFDLNGTNYPRGSFRIRALHPNGVAERQGACEVGDVLVSVGNVSLRGISLEQAKIMTRGSPGQSIVLGIHSKKCREVMQRHVVLAPPPSSRGTSPRYNIPSSRSKGSA
eukprot:765838-Hanusia_phi.AAC.6